MCKECVEQGIMTQDDLDQANAKGPGSDPRQDNAAAYAMFGPNLEDAPEFIKELLGSMGKGKKDPNVEAQEEMDGQIKNILEFYREHMGNAKEAAPELSATPRGVVAIAEAMAGVLLFKQNSSAIAYTLTILIHRYAELLDQWAELYVMTADDPDVPINLDAATTAESKMAVSEASTKLHPERTGMYL